MSGPTPATVAALLKSQMWYKPFVPTSSFQGQTVIVTGGNAGLGREAALRFVRLNAGKVILAVRTQAKGEDASKYIEQAAGRHGVVEVWKLDMGSFASVQAFARRVASLPRIDAVIANAGTWPQKFELMEGHEATITVNVLSTFLLIQLLLPHLRRSTEVTGKIARVTVVTSTLHAFATLPARKIAGSSLLSALDDPSLKDFGGRYNDSKLLVQLYGSNLAASMSADVKDRGQPEVCLNFVSPGWCSSNLHPSAGVGRLAEKVMARSTDEGARCLVDAVALERVEGRHGQFIDDQKIKRPAPWLASEEGRQTAVRVRKEFDEVIMPLVREEKIDVE